MSEKRKLVFVTGSAKRVGADIVRYFGARGFDVLIHANQSAAEAQGLAEFVRTEHGVEASVVLGDLSDEKVIQDIFSSYAPDIVVNNAGRFEPGDLDANLDANMRAVYLVSMAAIERMRADKKRGVMFIVGDAFISKGGVYDGDLLGYTMSKAWIPEAVRELGAAYGKHGIRVIGILNGPIEPPPSASPGAIEAIKAEINLPQEDLTPWIGGTKVSEAIHALLLATAINGATIPVDGGRSWGTAREH